MTALGILKRVVGNGGKSKLHSVRSKEAARKLTQLELAHAKDQEQAEAAHRALEARDQEQVAMLARDPGRPSPLNSLSGERDAVQVAEARAERSGKAVELAREHLEKVREAEPSDEKLLTIQTRYQAAKKKVEDLFRACAEEDAAIQEFLEAREEVLSVCGRDQPVVDQPVGLLGIIRFRQRLWLAAPQNSDSRLMV